LTDRIFETKIYDAAPYALTSGVESFNHSVQRYITQTIGCTHNFYKARAQVAFLNYNFQKCWKVHGYGSLVHNKHSTYLRRAQHMPDITMPAISIVKAFLGPEFSSDSNFLKWCESETNILSDKKDRRFTQVLDSYKGVDGTKIKAITTMCPIKGENITDDKSDDINLHFLDFSDRPHFPFDHLIETIPLSEENAEILAEIRYQATEFNSIKSSIVQTVTATSLQISGSNNEEQDIIDEDDIVNLKVIDSHENISNFNDDDPECYDDDDDIDDDNEFQNDSNNFEN
jgi:hypothetical protein